MSTDRARQLRRTPTEPERRPWAILHGLRQRGYHFRRQHPIGPYYADFACVAAKLVIEVDGVTHTTESDIAYDSARDAFIKSHGFEVLRVWNNDVMENADGIFRLIEQALAAVTGLTPTPVPSPSEGGGRPRLRKQRTGLRELAKRTGDGLPSPSPVGGEVRDGGPLPPASEPSSPSPIGGGVRGGGPQPLSRLDASGPFMK